MNTHKSNQFHEAIIKELIELLSRFVKVPKSTHARTELYRELGLAGDDVVEFLTAIEKVYSINMKEFQIWQYFPDEGAMIMDWPLKLFGIKTRLDISNYQSLNFDDLAVYVFHQMPSNRTQQQD